MGENGVWESRLALISAGKREMAVSPAVHRASFARMALRTSSKSLVDIASSYGIPQQLRTHCFFFLGGRKSPNFAEPQMWYGVHLAVRRKPAAKNVGGM
jgi:hypothetical protein